MLYLLPVHGEQTLSLYACSKVCNKDDETIGVQGNADKITKQLEAQLAELNAKLEQSAREIVELNSVKAKAQAESAEHVRQIEEVESQVNQLTKLKQSLSKQLDEAKASLEEETRLRAKFQSEARNFQVSISCFLTYIC